MEDQSFEAIMGMFDTNDVPNQKAIVQQLRGQNDLGQLYSMSPTMGKVGTQMQTNALNSAKEIGDRRSEGLSRTRQAEQDKLAKEKYDQTLLGYSDIKQYEKADGTAESWGTNNRTGKVEPIPEMEGLKPFQKKYGTETPKMINIPGMADAKIGVYTDGRVLAPNGKIYPEHTAFAADYPDLAELAMQNSEQRKEREKFATDEGELNSARVESAYQAIGASEALVEDFRNMRKLVLGNSGDSGAWTNKLSAYWPTLRGNTALFESIKKSMALDNLGRWGLTPVSDKDLQYVMDATVPDLSEADMLVWLDHKEEAAQRLAEVSQIMTDFYTANGGKRPVGDVKVKLDKEIKQALGDFKFRSPVNDDEAKAATAAKAEVKADTPTAKAGIPTKLKGKITQGDWDSYSPEQQKQLAN